VLGGNGKGLLRIAAKHADVINIVSEAGTKGHISLDEMKRMTSNAFREKVDFVREEAKRHGRDPNAIAISNVVFNLVLTDSREATRKTLEAAAPMFRTSPEALAYAPLSLIGTPEECAVELRRRAKEWSVSQFIFSGAMAPLDEQALRRLKEQVLAHV
jgi:alkanesulfonate monooxygenase SsuD/methylene tetrahydromethanopterin reductase-like flavin-dependent oxidoreductase (luciferase family)